MNLKEAFRYQNKLQALLDEAQGILDCDSNVTNVANNIYLKIFIVLLLSVYKYLTLKYYLLQK